MPRTHRLPHPSLRSSTAPPPHTTTLIRWAHASLALALSLSATALLILTLTLTLTLTSALLAASANTPVTTTQTYSPPTLAINSDIVSYFALYDVSLTYLLQAPDVSITFGTGTVVTNSKSFFLNELDAASISAPLTPAQRALRTSVTAFPFLAAAITPVYRVDTLDPNAAPLTFSRDLLVGMFTGRVRMWNDPAIVALNPLATLPNSTITVVLPLPGCDPAPTFAFTNALRLFNASALPFTPGTAPAWPLSSYAAYKTVNTTGQSSAIASTVATTNLAISYTTQAAALSVGALYGNMVNRAGAVVSPSSTSVNFALVELSTQSVQGSTATYDTMPLNDGSGSSVWPICVASFFLVDLEYSRGACNSREALVRFMLFIYQSWTVKQLFQDRGYSTMPDVVMNALNIVSRLSNDLLCRGSPALPASTSSKILIVGAPRAHFMLNLQATAYSVANTNISFSYTDNESDVAFAQLLSSEVDMVAVYPEELDQTKLAAARQSGQFIMLPLFLDTISIAFNLQITTTVDLTFATFDPLVLDMPTLLYIFTQRVTSWLDPLVVALNPNLANVFLANVTSAPITVVRVCGSQNSPYRYMAMPFRNYAMRYNQSLLPLVDEYEAMPTVRGVAKCEQPVLANGVAWTPNFPAIESTINSIPGAIGLFEDNQPEGVEFHRAQIRIRYPRYNPVTGTTSLYTTYSRPASSRSCFDVFDYKELGLVQEDSHAPNCYPLQDYLYLMGRKAFSSSLTNAASCERGRTAIEMMLWLMVTDGLTVASDAQNWVRYSSIPQVKAAYIEALNQSTCDGEPLLYYRPVVWELNGSIATIGQVGTAIGIAYCVVAFVLIGLHHNHPVIRSASPIFVAMSMLGVMFLLISCVLWVASPTLATCSSFAWMLSLGFYLTFGPLFAKTWRIYRIFGRAKLKVVKITNARLAMLVGIGLMLELSMLVAWQAASPVQPIDVVEWSGVPLREHDYVKCGVSGAGSAFFLVSIVSKMLMLVFGCVMAFTTRKVKSMFNESSGIARATYNLLFTTGLVLPLTMLVSSVGDVYTMLVLFLLLWIAMFTAFELTASKFGIVLKLVKLDEEVMMMSSGGSHGGFSFMSLSNFTTRSSLEAYMHALESHLEATRKHLKTMPRPNLAEVSKKHGASVSQFGGLTSRKGAALSVRSDDDDYGGGMTNRPMTTKASMDGTRGGGGGGGLNVSLIGAASTLMTTSGPQSMVDVRSELYQRLSLANRRGGAADNNNNANTNAAQGANNNGANHNDGGGGGAAAGGSGGGGGGAGTVVTVAAVGSSAAVAAAAAAAAATAAASANTASASTGSSSVPSSTPASSSGHAAAVGPIAIANAVPVASLHSGSVHHVRRTFAQGAKSDGPGSSQQHTTHVSTTSINSQRDREESRSISHGPSLN